MSRRFNVKYLNLTLRRNTLIAIRENIIKLREMNQITQEQLAEIAGVSKRGAVSQWERAILLSHAWEQSAHG